MRIRSIKDDITEFTLRLVPLGQSLHTKTNCAICEQVMPKKYQGLALYASMEQLLVACPRCAERYGDVVAQ